MCNALNALNALNESYLILPVNAAFVVQAFFEKIILLTTATLICGLTDTLAVFFVKNTAFYWAS
jgi:hypothetical protein